MTSLFAIHKGTPADRPAHGRAPTLRALTLAAMLIAAMLIVACGSDTETGEVVSIDTEYLDKREVSDFVPVDPAAPIGTIPEEAERSTGYLQNTPTGVEVDLGDETVYAEVSEDDQDRVHDLYANDELDEGSQVEVEPPDDGGYWVFVDVSD